MLPYRVGLALDKAFRSCGLKHKTVHEDGLRFRVRRLTSDVDFVTNVVRDKEYLPEGITINPDATIVDVGGNIGTFACQMAKMATRGRVISVEPAPDNLALLRLNIERNGFTDRVTVVPAAVSDTPGVITLNLATEGGYHTIVDGQLTGGKGTPLEVQSVTLRQLWERFRVTQCDLLKLDCEGAEYAILPALEPELLRSVRQIAMEYHRSGQIDPIMARLRSLGFTVVSHRPFTHGGHLFLRQAD